MILDAELDAIAMTEIELADVAMQMLLVTMLIDALHTAFEHGIEALRRVDTNFDAGQTVFVAIFFAAVINHAVFGEVLSEVGIGV